VEYCRTSSLVTGCHGRSFGFSWFRSGVVVFGSSRGGWNSSCQIASTLSSAYMAFGLFGPLVIGGVG
jgi:hypothetical protein